jgi:hypothetical protein
MGDPRPSMPRLHMRTRAGALHSRPSRYYGWLVAGAPPVPFGPSWEKLKLRDVRAFLRSRPTERAIWEAKQQDTKAKLARFVREECCGFANRRGGYLLLGAEDKKGAGWDLRGVELPGVKEIHDWVASLLRELSPVPGFDVHEWKLGNGRHVVVVQVEQALQPPVSYGNIVYLRHGTQTIRADGPAIRRLAEQGRREERRVETKARKHAKELAEQMSVPFAIAIGRSGDRDQPLSSSEPETVASARLREALAKRWRKRRLDKMEWVGQVANLENEALRNQRRAGLPGWRVAWKVVDVAQTKRHDDWWARRRGRRSYSALRSGPRRGDEDIFSMHLVTDAVAVSAQWAFLGGGDYYERFGARSVSNAEVVLRALIATELELGARPEEPVFISLALRNPWSSDTTIFIETWSHLGLNARAWRAEALEAAGRKMHLEPPAEFVRERQRRFGR